jgi:ubiquinol oxidase
MGCPESQINFLTEILRDPGSVFLPLLCKTKIYLRPHQCWEKRAFPPLGDPTLCYRQRGRYYSPYQSSVLRGKWETKRYTGVMEKKHTLAALEKLNIKLNDQDALAQYAQVYNDYRPAYIARMLGGFLVACGNAVYGHEPSYLKFRSIEIIARVPYHSWASAMYTLLTLHFADERRAMELSKTALFSRLAQDNETMHVVAISQVARKECEAGAFVYTFIPMVFALAYFWTSYWLFLINPRYSYDINFLFEDHAFRQYSRFLEVNEKELKNKLAQSEFLAWYGRTPANQYEFFQSLRNDELIHRNASANLLNRPKKA